MALDACLVTVDGKILGYAEQASVELCRVGTAHHNRRITIGGTFGD